MDGLLKLLAFCGCACTCGALCGVGVAWWLKRHRQKQNSNPVERLRLVGLHPRYDWRQYTRFPPTAGLYRTGPQETARRGGTEVE